MRCCPIAHIGPRWEWSTEEAPLLPCDRVFEVDRRACPMHKLYRDDAVCIRLIALRRRARGYKDRLYRPDPGPRAPEYSG